MAMSAILGDAVWTRAEFALDRSGGRIPWWTMHSLQWGCVEALTPDIHSQRCGYLHAGGVAAASFSLVEPHPTDESAFCDSMGSATVSRLGGLALPHLDLTDLFVSL